MFCPDAGGSAILASPPSCPFIYMSLRSNPLLQCRSYEPCSALMQAARRSWLPTPPRENRACWGPRTSPPFVSFIFRFYVSLRQTLAPRSGKPFMDTSTGKSACATFLKEPCHVPKAAVPHFLDALGQTHNYFTSRASPDAKGPSPLFPALPARPL